MYLFLKNYFLFKYQSIMHKNHNAMFMINVHFIMYNLYEPMKIKCTDAWIHICMHKTMASVASLEKIEIIRSQEFMPSEARLKFLKKKMIFLDLKLPFWGLNFVEFWCWGLIFGGQGGPAPLDLPLSQPFLYNDFF